MDVKKYVLDKIVSLGPISENSLADISNAAGMALEEEGKSLPAPPGYIVE